MTGGNAPETTGLHGNPGRFTMAGIGLLAGGVAAFVLTLLAAVVTAVTPLQASLSGLAAISTVAGLGVAVDGARQQSPGAVIVRSAYLVAVLLFLAGLVLGGYVWFRLPAPEGRKIVRYAPAIPILFGGILAAGVGVLGILFDRHLSREL